MTINDSTLHAYFAKCAEMLHEQGKLINAMSRIEFRRNNALVALESPPSSAEDWLALDKISDLESRVLKSVRNDLDSLVVYLMNTADYLKANKNKHLVDIIVGQVSVIHEFGDLIQEKMQRLELQKICAMNEDIGDIVNIKNLLNNEKGKEIGLVKKYSKNFESKTNTALNRAIKNFGGFFGLFGSTSSVITAAAAAFGVWIPLVVTGTLAITGVAMYGISKRTEEEKDDIRISINKAIEYSNELIIEEQRRIDEKRRMKLSAQGAAE